MTVYEKEEYFRRPTTLNALLVPLRTETKLRRAIKITIIVDNVRNDYFIELNKKGFTFLKVEGLESILSFEQQKKKFEEKISKIARANDNYDNSLNDSMGDEHSKQNLSTSI